jgi:hypothetical protein
LRLLHFEVETGGYGCYRPLLGSEKWLRRWRWMDRAGARWWPFFGAAYVLVAVKQVHGVRMLEPAWRKTASKSAATVPLARRSGDNSLSIQQEQHE